jgi:hypothetical protein
MKTGRSSGVGRGPLLSTRNRRAVRGFPAIRHAAILACKAASKGGTRGCNSSSGTLVKSSNSSGRACSSGNRQPAMGRASCHSSVEAHHTRKKAG